MNSPIVQRLFLCRRREVGVEQLADGSGTVGEFQEGGAVFAAEVGVETGELRGFACPVEAFYCDEEAALLDGWWGGLWCLGEGD